VALQHAAAGSAHDVSGQAFVDLPVSRHGLLALAVGGDTFKLKYGHRSANQPCIEHDASGKPTQKCIITSQNHGFAVKPELPAGWRVWFTNANDGTIEGIRHESGRFFSVQFHPEATPGPEDANYLFDDFLAMLK